jgi:putative ABC transport system ATP-binding protein
MNKPLITVKELTYRYENTEQNALQNINLTINQGDYLAIVGTSGSGKSTLLSILGLLNKPSSGQYLILGTDTQKLTNKSLSAIKNNEIGFIFQNFNLLNRLNVFDNVALPLIYNTDVKRGEYRERVLKALTEVEMQDFISRFPDQLSGGQQQRIAIARALVNQPSIIFADEPTGNLDSKNSENIFALLKKLHNSGKTLCLITHDVNYAKQADKILQMSDGQLSNFTANLAVA